MQQRSTWLNKLLIMLSRMVYQLSQYARALFGPGDNAILPRLIKVCEKGLCRELVQKMFLWILRMLRML